MKKLNTFFWQLLFLLLPFHALIVTLMKYKFGLIQYSFFIHSWKELLVFLIALSSIILVIRNINTFKKNIKLNLIDYTIFMYFFIGLVVSLFVNKNFIQVIYGFKYDYMFLVVYLLARISSLYNIKLNKVYKMLFISGAITIGFSIIWYHFLPLDFLKYLGYNENITKYVAGQALPIFHTVDRYSLIPRLTSTFSGPNHFASFLLIFIPLLGVSIYKIMGTQKKCFFSFLFVLSVYAIYLTYSRSAWIGMGFEIILCILIIIRKNRRLLYTFFSVLSLLTISITLYIAFNLNTIKEYIITCSENTSISNEETNTYIKCSSTRGHFDRNLDGLIRSVSTPFGHGLGTAGPASDYTEDQDKGIYAFHPESWYLQIFFEMGYAGVIVFLILVFEILYILYKNINMDNIWLLLGFTGVSVMAIFLHAWEEPSTSMILWGVLGLNTRYFINAT